MTVLFVATSLSVNQVIRGTPWFLLSSGLRLIFGIVILWLAKKVYGMQMSEVFRFQNAKASMIAALGFFTYFLYYIVLVCIRIKDISGLTIGLLISKVI